jgi:hypothetical protein
MKNSAKKNVTAFEEGWTERNRIRQQREAEKAKNNFTTRARSSERMFRYHLKIDELDVHYPF